MNFMRIAACALLLTTSLINCNETNTPKPEYSWKTHAACGLGKTTGIVIPVYIAYATAPEFFSFERKLFERALFLVSISGALTVGHSAWSSFKKAFALYKNVKTKKA